MNLSRNSETAPSAQPRIVYEHSSVASIGHIGEMHSQNPDTKSIVGFEEIDTHLEGLLETWEEKGNVDAAIDACTIISRLPEHYPPLSVAMQDALVECVLNKLHEIPKDAKTAREIVIRSRQMPEVYQQLTEYVQSRLDSSDLLDAVVKEPLVSAYLDAFSLMDLGREGPLEALRYLLHPCKLDDSEL